MLFCILNCSMCPIPRTHYLHVMKLAAGFVQNGYHFKEISNLSDVHYLTEFDILYISNHFSVDLTHRFVQKLILSHLVSQLQKTNCRLLLWNFHTVDGWNNIRIENNRCLHIGELLLPKVVNENPKLSRFREKYEVFELKYSSPVLPKNSFAKRPDTYHFDCNFVGNGYQPILTSYVKNKYNAFIINTPPIIPEAQRWNSFRNSKINLVFHSKGNLANGVIVERFAEALSLGGIILHDHPRINEIYGNRPGLRIVQSVTDLDCAITEVKEMSKCQEDSVRQENYQLWKNHGLSYNEQAIQIVRRFN